LYRRHHDEARRNVYLLCASSFTAKQYNSAMLFKDKCLKFGYFPNGNIFDTNLDCKTMIHEGPLEIMWAGIFIDWKHPEMALLAADELYKHGIDFHLTMVGYGDEHKNIDPAVAARPYHDKITITGNMTNKDTLKLMAKTDVYLFTSDIGEGWGAVLNESMSSGCAVLASKQAGSTNYLVKDGVNGMTYSGRGEFVKKLLFLAKNREEATRIGQAARKTIVDVWNGRVAVQNLLRAYEILQKKESITKDMINGGPSTFIR
jgi:glycosyltransferase involved in cell wall biosynthesis